MVNETYLYKKVCSDTGCVTHKPLAYEIVPFFIFLLWHHPRNIIDHGLHLLAEDPVFKKSCSLTRNIRVLIFGCQKYDLSCKYALLICLSLNNSSIYSKMSLSEFGTQAALEFLQGNFVCLYF